MARVDIQGALLEDNKALREEIAAAHAILDRAGRVEPAMRLSERVEGLTKETDQLRAASTLALTAFRARRDVEEHVAEAAMYDSCADCCNQRPCPEFQRLEAIAQSAAATAMAALAREGASV